MQRILALLTLSVLIGCATHGSPRQTPLPTSASEEPPLAYEQALHREYDQLAKLYGDAFYPDSDAMMASWFDAKRDYLDTKHDVLPDIAQEPGPDHWDGSKPPRIWVVGRNEAAIFDCFHKLFTVTASQTKEKLARARDQEPVAYAHLQARYDCWLAQVSRGTGGFISTSGDTECHREFKNVTGFLFGPNVCPDPIAPLSDNTGR